MTQTATVLVVDDEPRIREVLQHALEREGIPVATAPGGSALSGVADGDIMLAVLRRRPGGAHPDRAAVPLAAENGVLALGGLELDVPRHEVRVGSARVDLTPTEFEVLRALLEVPGRLLSRTDLILKAYHAVDGELEVTERTIDTYVRRIRAKCRPLGVDPVETVHGLGYKAREA